MPMYEPVTEMKCPDWLGLRHRPMPRARSMGQHHQGAYWECRITDPFPDFSNQDLHFDVISGWFVCILRYEKCCSRPNFSPCRKPGLRSFGGFSNVTQIKCWYCFNQLALLSGTPTHLPTHDPLNKTATGALPDLLVWSCLESYTLSGKRF